MRYFILNFFVFIFAWIPNSNAFAEMTLEKKNSISHRGKAIKALRPILTSYLNEKQTTKKESA